MNKTALITGASSGLGREFAWICAENGYDLVITARNTDALNALKNELEAKFGVRVFVFDCDLSQNTSADKICEFVRENSLKIDILINNAGFGDHCEFVKSDLKKQLEMVQVNIASLLNLTHYFANLMIEQNGGKILNIASAASLTAGPKMSVYYASKAFVRNFSVALGEELRAQNISVTAFCPGPVATNFGERAGVKNAKIFARSDDAGAVARRGFEAMMSGKTLVYDGRFMLLANLLTRIFPLKFCAKVTGFLNG
ncbi:SDR family NAD(P)-dependent oxidoreductase [Campylobacter sp. JMF_08 NE1]|uniref:SDR family NAD(P)-dependent oxidoreductase n=1 Tax=Campylobacter sp. JMF_08 NE1 TaxID=2983821 RepID=UPI0022E9DC13|nr:SDR family oxidoreductase [Campylobacter sp. JMF_08 NE1]MDA3048070.1 SDR family oxidoreductase [Campylobacter sp. JMF_08 NE1]